MMSSICWAVVLGAGVVLSATAEQTTVQHEAHEHGIAALDVALEVENLVVEFNSPAVNIVGFEHQPSSDDQKAAVTDAVATLKDADRVFAIPAEARCELVSVYLETELMHGDDHHSEEAHESDEHGHAEAEEVHSEFRAVYSYSCANADKLTSIKVNLIELYPGIDEIHTRVIGPSGQTAGDLTGSSPDLSL
jgi:hypothetical protein